MLSTIAVVLSVVPIPPVEEVTEVHRQAMQSVREVAVKAASAARPVLLSMLDDDVFRKHLRELDLSLSLLSSSELHNRLHQEMQVLEVTHSFEPRVKCITINDTCTTYDLSINSTIGYDYLINLWQLKTLGKNNYSTSIQGIFRDAETKVYHLPELPNVPTYEEASERLIYGALQWYKLSSASSAIYGGMAFVFDNNHIRNFTAISPIDTGSWEECCGDFIYFVPPAERMTLDCSAFGANKTHPVPGTYDHWEHLVTGNVRYWNITLNILNTTGPYRYSSPQEKLALLVARSLNTNYANIPETKSILSEIFYSEANPLMNLNYKKGVKTMIYNFTDGFGTDLGKQYQDWAISNNWVLVWTVVAHPLFPEFQNRRFVDPYVLSHTNAGKNFTTDSRFPSLFSNFTATWEIVNKSLPSIPEHDLNKWYLQQWDDAWGAFENTILHVQPLSGGACESSSCSVTRVIDGVCICR